MIHTLLKRRKFTGVTLQTMHPTRFDHGDILAQTPPPGVPVPHDCTPDGLLHVLGPLGAEMLSRGIETGVFVPPVTNFRDEKAELQQLDHAPKVSSEDRHIDWHTWTADEIQLRDRVLGRLWDMETYSRCFLDRSPKRTTFHGPWTVRSNSVDGIGTPGQTLLSFDESGSNRSLAFKTADGKSITPASATLDGERKGTGLHALESGIATDQKID